MSANRNWTNFNPNGLQKQWDRFTDEDLDEIADDQNKLIAKIQERYEFTESEAVLDLQDWEITYYDLDEIEINKENVKADLEDLDNFEEIKMPDS